MEHNRNRIRLPRSELLEIFPLISIGAEFPQCFPGMLEQFPCTPTPTGGSHPIHWSCPRADADLMAAFHNEIYLLCAGRAAPAWWPPGLAAMHNLSASHISWHISSQRFNYWVVKFVLQGQWICIPGCWVPAKEVKWFLFISLSKKCPFQGWLPYQPPVTMNLVTISTAPHPSITRSCAGAFSKATSFKDQAPSAFLPSAWYQSCTADSLPRWEQEPDQPQGAANDHPFNNPVPTQYIFYDFSYSYNAFF